MVIKLPLKVRLTTEAEADALARARDAVGYKPENGFLLDTPLTRLPEPAYRPRPCRNSYKARNA